MILLRACKLEESVHPYTLLLFWSPSGFCVMDKDPVLTRYKLALSKQPKSPPFSLISKVRSRSRLQGKNGIYGYMIKVSKEPRPLYFFQFGNTDWNEDMETLRKTTLEKKTTLLFPLIPYFPHWFHPLF